MNINLTLIGQTIIFGLFVWFCMKFIWPPIVEAMAARKKQIADGLAAAEKGHKAESVAKKKADKLIAGSKEQATEIINQANTRGNEVINEAKEKAIIEAQNIKQKAMTDIDAELNSAREQLRKDMSGLILQGVKQIITREIKESDHKEILSGLSAKL